MLWCGIYVLAFQMSLWDPLHHLSSPLSQWCLLQLCALQKKGFESGRWKKIIWTTDSQQSTVSPRIPFLSLIYRRLPNDCFSLNFRSMKPICFLIFWIMLLTNKSRLLVKYIYYSNALQYFESCCLRIKVDYNTYITKMLWIMLLSKSILIDKYIIYIEQEKVCSCNKLSQILGFVYGITMTWISISTQFV